VKLPFGGPRCSGTMILKRMLKNYVSVCELNSFGSQMKQLADALEHNNIRDNKTEARDDSFLGRSPFWGVSTISIRLGHCSLGYSVFILKDNFSV
jgi:hypothetical protein